MKTKQAYNEFIDLVKKCNAAGSILELLEWDQEIMMPPGAAWLRAKQSGALTSIIHELKTSKRFEKLLRQLEKAKDLTKDQKIIVSEVAFYFHRDKKVPNELVTEIAEITTHAVEVWRKAREKNNFKLFKPLLAEIVSLSQKKAKCIDAKKHPYEVLFNDFEKGITLEQAEQYLETIKQGIVPLLKQIAAAKQPKTQFLKKKVPVDVQKKFNLEVAKIIGYDFNKGRMDASTHPFTGCYGRITTRYTEGWLSAILGTVHETGHAMYEHGLPEKHFGTPLGESRSLSLHESQSRIWENHVGGSEAFWKYFYPKLKKAYGINVPFKDFMKAVNKVTPGFIRVEADELTYTLHVILRFEIEKSLIEGSLKVDDIPKAWNKKMKELLGVTPPSDSKGCLQDIHWSLGLFGYFPAYSLGSMMAAQEFAAVLKKHPDIEKRFAKGDFSQLLKWLGKKIHSQGCRYNTNDLIKFATGKFPDPKDYITYLNKKYKKAYVI